ncbi:Transmembrane protein, putative [Angomonas deanei]|uniref:Transmembrane protein, putative n=1 Tax=Angomonas deanei TaxID=59799 RepID=A0A7G2C9I4_9TRYP|nr:Transmembrane protein, putative [Angomonas deanei]
MTILLYPERQRRLLLFSPTFYKRLNENLFIPFRIGMIVFYFCCFIIQCQVKDQFILEHSLLQPPRHPFSAENNIVFRNISENSTLYDFDSVYSNNHRTSDPEKVFAYSNNITNQTTFSFNQDFLFFNESGNFYFTIEKVEQYWAEPAVDSHSGSTSTAIEESGSAEENTRQLVTALDIKRFHYIYSEDDYRFLTSATDLCFAASFLCLCLNLFGVLTTRTLKIEADNVFQSLCGCAAGVLIIVCTHIGVHIARFWHIFYIFVIIPAGFEILLIFYSYWKGMERY